MFERFKKGPIPSDLGLAAYESVSDYPGSGYDGSSDGDQAELLEQYPVDPKLFDAHKLEVPK